jgi:hypothetical protein
MRAKISTHTPMIAAAFFCAVMWSNSGAADGALAVGLPPDVVKGGFTYGYSTGYADVNQAEAHALDSCRTTKDASTNAKLRSLCKVIQDFTNRCVAVAMDPQAGTPGVGWSVADDLHTAEAQALGKCEDTAGPGRRAACVVDHSKCDGSAK